MYNTTIIIIFCVQYNHHHHPCTIRSSSLSSVYDAIVIMTSSLYSPWLTIKPLEPQIPPPAAFLCLWKMQKTQIFVWPYLGTKWAIRDPLVTKQPFQQRLSFFWIMTLCVGHTRVTRPEHRSQAGILGKPHWNWWPRHLGIAQIAFAPPSPHSNGHSGALFPGRFEQICQITVLTVHKCTKHPGKP